VSTYVGAKELAAEFGINRITVKAHLHRAEAPLRRLGLDAEQTAEAAALYKAGWSSGRLARRYDASADTVLKALRQCGVANSATAWRAETEGTPL